MLTAVVVVVVTVVISIVKVVVDKWRGVGAE